MQSKGIHFRKKSFGNLIKDYQKYRRSYDLKVYDQLFKLVGKNKKQVKILDLGCGSGKSTEPLLKYSDQYKIDVIGYDHDEKMLKEARLSATRKDLSINYIHGKAERLPFDESEFDVVIAGTAFHWFANKRALSEIQRVLKTNGVFFIFWKNPTTILNINGQKVGYNFYKRFKCKSILGNWRDTNKVKKIFNTAGFKKFNTFSKYAALTEAQKRLYIRQLTNEYQKALGDRKHFISMRETVVCYSRNS